MAQNYRDALGKNGKFWGFFEHGGKGMNMFKFCFIDLMKTRSMVHLRHEIIYSAHFPALEVDKRSPRRFKQLQGGASNSGVVCFECRMHEGTKILAALLVF
jgi:hypothetical protein